MLYIAISTRNAGMKHKLLIAIIGIASVFYGCSHVYAPALYHQDIAYMPKPASFDTNKTAAYISGGIDGHSSTNYTDFLASGQLNVSVGHRFNGFNLAYGGFASFGDYSQSGSKTDSGYFGDKFFGAVGGRFSANAFITSGRADIRFIGIEMAYSHEFGSYANYRKQINNAGGYFVDPRVDLFTIGLTTEVIFHNRNDNGFQHSIRGFLGTTLGHDPLEDTYYTTEDAGSKLFRKVFPKASYFIKYKNYFGTAEVGNNFFIRFGYTF